MKTCMISIVIGTVNTMQHFSHRKEMVHFSYK